MNYFTDLKMFGRSVTGVQRRVVPGGILLLLAMTVTVLYPCDGLRLCKRCENSEMSALRDYYDSAGFSQLISFRRFLTSLLETMSRFRHLSDLYWELKKLIHRYDDCLVTCGISFSKRYVTRQRGVTRDTPAKFSDVHPVQLWLARNGKK